MIKPENKILGKYNVVEPLGEDKYIATLNEQKYVIEPVQKPEHGSVMYSDTARQISAVQHENISKLSIDEDDNNFYFIEKYFDSAYYNKLEAESFLCESTDFVCGGINTDNTINYQLLLKCYIQIASAIQFIHQKGFFHGNINPDNIRIGRDENAYLLDFGRSYMYSMLKNMPSKTFFAPEQLEQSEPLPESDIFSFGLCMIKLIVDNFEDFDFFDSYKSPADLESMFSQILEEYELEDMENSLFLLTQKMLALNPKDRISLADIQKELRQLLAQVQDSKTFAIEIYEKTRDKYAELHSILQYEVREHIQQKIEGHRAFWEFGTDKQGRFEIKIAVGNIVFFCAVRDNAFKFFCFQISELPSHVENITRHGLETNDTFKIASPGQPHSRTEFDNVSEVVRTLAEQYKLKQIKLKRQEIDIKAIASEEDLLEAEYKTIQEKKNTRQIHLMLDDAENIQGIDRGKETITFKFAEDDYTEQPTKDIDSGDTMSLGEMLVISKNENQVELAGDNSHKTKDFKKGQDVVINSQERDDFELKAQVVQTDVIAVTVTVKLDKYGTTKFEQQIEKGEIDKTEILTISYDYKVEEIIWGKQNSALEELKTANTAIHNLLRKINEPSTFIKGELADISRFFNDRLDDNQKLAVQKSLSLGEDCEVMIIQGPPGTGKTTTITEIVMQILKTKTHDKILVASQSNQAVDNVLEKICQIEDKILRIGKDEKKMSSVAAKYAPDSVLNKIISENRKRLKENNITHDNKDIEKRFQELQQEFDKSLQTLTAKIANSATDEDKRKGKKSRDGELGDLFTRNIRLIFGTLLGISSWKNFREMVFDWIIVDEAGRATLSELLVPCIKAKKLILVGDHKQLSPVIDDEVLEKIEDKEGAKTSFFQRYFERLQANDGNQNKERPNLRHTLTSNYRSERRICDLYSKAFYGGLLRVSDEVNKTKQHGLAIFDSSVVWIDTGKLPNRGDTQKGTGKINNCNCQIVSTLVQSICSEIQKQKADYGIGIITPYKAQKDLLSQKINTKSYEPVKIDIGTVDSFQGSDRDIIIYDCVRSGKSKKKARIDFIADEKRLNVSLSRAKKLLVIVGDMDFLYNAGVGGSAEGGGNPFVEIIETINSDKASYQIIKLEDKNGSKAAK